MAAPKEQHTQIAEAMLRRILRVAELLAPYAVEEQTLADNQNILPQPDVETSTSVHEKPQQ